MPVMQTHTIDAPGATIAYDIREGSTDEPPLMRLVEAVEGLPPDPNSPGDAAEQHDHYLYGTPKRKNP